jgi:hypothetical protein
MYRREVAYHEAGHTVVHLLYGHPICEVTVRPDRDRGSAGHVESVYGGIIEKLCMDDDSLRMELLRQLVRASYAGYAAQCLANPRADRERSGQDDLQASELASGFLSARDGRRWHHRQMTAAQALVSKHRSAVEAIAGALLKRTTLAPSAARSIVREHVSSVPEEVDYFNLRGEFWDQKTVARHYGVTVATLRRWRTEHRGPRPFTIGRYVRYHACHAPEGSGALYAVDEWEVA